MNKRSLLPLAVAAISLTIAGRASATEDIPPFDPYDCWCIDKFMDVSIGHFDHANGLFVIDAPIWNEGKEEKRQPGTTLDIGYTFGGKDTFFLIFDRSWSREQWCFQTVDSYDPEAVLLRSIACSRMQAQGGILPDSCEHYAPLSQVVKFSKAVLSESMTCRDAANNYLGMGRETGCATGMSSWWALLALLSLRTFRWKV